MACGQGSTIKGIPDNVRDYIEAGSENLTCYPWVWILFFESTLQLVGNRADVKFDTLSRKKIPQELYDNEGCSSDFISLDFFS